MDDLIRNSEKRGAVSGNLLVTTELGGKSVTAPAVLLAAFPDRLRLELQDPVGGVLALLVVNGGRFWLYQHDRPEIVTGPVRLVPKSILPVADGADVARIFLARPPAETLRTWSLTGGSAIGGEGEVSWKGDLAEPSEWTQHPAGMKDGWAVTAQYEDYEFKAGLRYPTKIRITEHDFKQDDRTVLLAWKDWEPSVPESKKLFQIPQSETFGRKIKELR